MGVRIDKAREYCRKHTDWRSSDIAKRLIRDFPLVYSTTEEARKAVRQARGRDGVKNRTQFAKSCFRPVVRIPDSDAVPRQPFVLPLPASVLLLSDLHVPYHDVKALSIAIETGIKHGCNSVYINGDALDCYQISRFEKDPTKRSLKGECEKLEEVLTFLEGRFKHRYFKFGNHDDRWQIYLQQQAPAFAEFAEFKLERVLKLEERGWSVVQSRQRAQFGLLHVLHGHEATRGLSAPVNPARGVWLKIKATCIVGHWHQPSHHTENQPLDKRVVASWSTGCLCDLSPDYASINNWLNGFAIVDVAKSGSFEVRNYRIIDGKAFPA